MIEQENSSELLEKYGNLKMTVESEGDGYFFYGYGLPSEYNNDVDLVEAFKLAESSVENFKKIVEKRITDNGGDPEEFTF